MLASKTTLDSLQPTSLWKNFQAICEIPHVSHDEQKITKFLKNFGQSLKLETVVDGAGNVLIKKPAMPGMENKKVVVLQSHVDMVAQKNSNKQHDFSVDPIEPYVDDGWVTANGTTLGADNGIGAAAMMAILESDDIAHPTIEALFTVNEEDGMAGAAALSTDLLSGEILFNLDSEDDEMLCVGCAGGVYTDVTFHYKTIEPPINSCAFRISISGLIGGHSGFDIHRGRANAVKIVSRIIWRVQKKIKINIASLEAGSAAHNAIAREAFAIIVISRVDEEKFRNVIDQLALEFENEVGALEDNLKISVEQMQMPNKIMDKKAQIAVVNALLGCPHGVMRMSDDFEGVVDASTNLGYVKISHGKVLIYTFQRSFVESDAQYISDMVRAIFDLAGGEVVLSEQFPGWKPCLESQILGVMRDIYRDEFDVGPRVLPLHAGLECGIFKNKYPNMDIVAIGPTIVGAHSPDERVNIKSVEKFWRYLVEALRLIPR